MSRRGYGYGDPRDYGESPPNFTNPFGSSSGGPPPPPVFSNPWASSGSSRRPSHQDYHGYDRRPSRQDYHDYGHRPSQYDDIPMRSRSTRAPSSHHAPPMFSNPFSSGSLHRSGSSSRHMSGSSRHGSSFADMHPPPGMRPPPGRRMGTDLSAAAADPYNPFHGEFMHRRQTQTDGDPELPPYRSASAYARGSASRAPVYDELPSRSSRSHSRYGTPPPQYRYPSTHSSQGGYAPMQFPPTRRPSHFYPHDLPDRDYFHRKDSCR